MQMGTDSMTNQIPDNTKTETFGIFLDRCRDVIEMIASFGKFNSLKKALSGNFNQFFGIIVRCRKSGLRLSGILCRSLLHPD